MEKPNTEYLKQLTVIIPTFNRHLYLQRLLNYYARQKIDISFLILDSSEPTIADLNRQMISTILNNRAKHIIFSPDVPVATKLLEGLKLVKTEYSAFCADDDVVFVDGLMEALAYLHAHPDYVCVDGIYLNFNPNGKNIHLTIEYATKGINSEDPGARIFKLCQKYESLFYGVFRTKQALAVFTGVNKQASLHYQELFQAASALLLGKSHRLPIFYAARQHCDPAQPERDKWQTYYWFAENTKEFMEHYLIYREELWDFYQAQVKQQNYSKETFLQLIDIAHAMYFGLGCPPAYFHSVLEHRWPNETYQKANVYQYNICNQLKSLRRVWWETKIEKFSLWIPKKIASLYSLRDMRNLNKTIKQNTSGNWICQLSPDLRWLASVEIFCCAYRELCLYMSCSEISTS